MTERETLQAHVAEELRAFLTANQMRQTRERFAILRAAYAIDGTFTIDDLQTAMQTMRFHVSTATLYQTVQLLVQANLLIRHPFSSSAAMFESIDDTKPRSYQVCTMCNAITHIKSKMLATSIEAYKPRSFAVTQRIAYIYGTCAKCQRKQRKMRQQQAAQAAAALPPGGTNANAAAAKAKPSANKSTNNK
ncbi:MAG: transcriptional repressor [Bacteroidaceae bacterium]|nr:transcriptional repressor [Bacteroidaceae bacterium]